MFLYLVSLEKNIYFLQKIPLSTANWRVLPEALGLTFPFSNSILRQSRLKQQECIQERLSNASGKWDLDKNKCSDRQSLTSRPFRQLGQIDRPTKRTTNRPTKGWTLGFIGKLHLINTNNCKVTGFPKNKRPFTKGLKVDILRSLYNVIITEKLRVSIYSKKGVFWDTLYFVMHK